MSIGRYALLGLRDAVRHPKTVFLLWFLNALLGLTVYFSAAGLIRRAFGSSLLASTLNERFVFRGVQELLANHGRDVAGLASLVLMLMVITLVLSLFLAGGVLQVLIEGRLRQQGQGESREAGLFFQGAGKYFGRFVRLEIFALPMWIVFGIVLVILAGLTGIASDGGVKERLGFSLGLALAGTSVFFFLLGRMVIDYARIHIAATGTTRVFRTLAATTGFVSKKFFKLLGLYGLFLLIVAVVYAAGEAAGLGLNRGTTVAVTAGFGFQQVLLLVLFSVKIALQGAQIRLSLAERIPAPVSAAAAQDPGGEHEQGLDDPQDSVHGDSQQPKGQQEEPDDRV